jgi:predicted nucleic acid-binding protein
LAKPIGVIDASCVIALDALNLLPQLTFLFAHLHVPKAVRRELHRRRSTKDRMRALLREYAVIQRCNDYDQGAVDVLLVERRADGTSDLGEVEAVVQAAKLGAVVVVDDPWGYRAPRHTETCKTELKSTGRYEAGLRFLLRYGPSFLDGKALKLVNQFVDCGVRGGDFALQAVESCGGL